MPWSDPELRALASGYSAGLAHELLFQIADHLTHMRIDLHSILYLTASVQHRSMVAPAKGFADGVERTFRHLPGQIHGHLAREGDVFRTTLARHVGQPDVKMLSHLLLNDIDAHTEAAFF